MTENVLFNLKTLISSLDFVLPDMAWRLYRDHVYSNYDGLDLSVSIYKREGDVTQFLLNHRDVNFKFNDRDVRIVKDFDQLEKMLRALYKMGVQKQHPQIDMFEFILGSTANKA